MKKEYLNSDLDSFLAKWLEGELTDQEFKNLVNEDDYNAFLKIRHGLHVRNLLDRPTDATFSKIQDKIQSKKDKVRPLYSNWAIGIAASIALLFGLFMFLDTGEIIIETGFGESKTIALLDGSEVILNSKTKIIYDEDNWIKERKLYLDGEAYFRVTKGEGFVVITNSGTVSVLGTQFNVNSTTDFFDVVCFEGKVGVKTLQSDHVLYPTDTFRKINGNTSEVSKTLDKMPAWVNGESTFKSVPLRYVIKALEEQYQIEFDDKSINDSDIFTGSFPHDSLNVALKTVFETLNIKYTEKEKRNIKLRYKE